MRIRNTVVKLLAACMVFLWGEAVLGFLQGAQAQAFDANGKWPT